MREDEEVRINGVLISSLGQFSFREPLKDGEVSLPKVALRKRRDKTNFDGQTDNGLARRKHRHRKRREKTAGKETTPMKRNDADDEGVQMSI